MRRTINALASNRSNNRFDASSLQTASLASTIGAVSRYAPSRRRPTAVFPPVRSSGYGCPMALSHTPIFGAQFRNRVSGMQRVIDFPILEKATLRQSRASSLDTPYKSCDNGEKAREDTLD